MKNFFKSMTICTGLLVTSFTIAFLAQYRKQEDAPIKTIEQVPLTEKEQLINSLTSISCFNVNASIDIKTEDNSVVDIDFAGSGDASDLSNIKLDGHLDAGLNGVDLSANLSYFDSTIFFDYRDNYFTLETDSVLDFITMLPTYGLNIELPIDLSNLDIGALEESLLNMEDKKQTPTGEFYFTYKFNDDLTLYFKTNKQNEFTGIRSDSIFFKGNLIKLDVDLDRIEAEDLDIKSPLLGENALKYQRFEPAFTIIDDLVRFIKKDSATVNIDFDLKKYGEEETTDILSTDLNISFDKSNKLYGLDGSINENGRNHDFLFAYQNARLFANYHNVKASLGLQSLEGVVAYALKKIGEEKLTEVLSTVVASLSDVDIMGLIGNLGNTIGHIDINETTFSIDINPSVFEVEGLNTINVKLDFDDEKLKSITLLDLNIMGYGGDVVISFLDYVPFEFNEEDYVDFDPAFTLIEGIDELLDDTQFRIEFDASIDKVDPSEGDITIDGGLQFDIENMFGYGELDIIDGTGYDHYIKADMKSPEEILFSYNDTMNGKFNKNTLVELIDLVMDVVSNPDEHFIELFGEMLSSVNEMPIMAALNGDIGLLFDTQIIKNIEVNSDYLEISLYLDIAGFENKSITIHIDYSEYHFEGISISSDDLIDGASFSFNGYLLPFDDSLESTRLDPYEEYMDFSDIKVLLELGINTSKFNYFHFTSTINLSLGSLLGDLIKIPLDVKIRNDHGDVQVEANMSNIPTIIAVNKNSDLFSTNSRNATIYYADGLISLLRVDKGWEHIISFKDSTWTLVKVMEPDYFINNILEVLLKDLLGLSNTMYNLVGNLELGSDEQIHYEKILNNFIFNENDGYFYFDINLAEIAHSQQMKSFVLKVYEANDELTGLDVSLSISVLITIKVEMTLTLADKEVELNDSNRLTNVESFMAAYGEVERNVNHVTLSK